MHKSIVKKNTEAAVRLHVPSQYSHNIFQNKVYAISSKLLHRRKAMLCNTSKQYYYY